MPDTVRVLIVEDEAKEIEEWRGRIELHNADEENGGFAIADEYAQSKGEVIELLPARKFDAAVVDLRLNEAGKGAQHNNDGNEIVKMLSSTEMAAVAVYTGQPSEAIIPKQSPIIKIIPKGEGLESVINWLKEESKLIFRVQKAYSIIHKDMALMFHSSIWPRWKYWAKQAGNVDELDAALTRHLVSHLYANLLDATDGVHPEEWYFVPPMENRPVSTGDLILNRNKKVEVVITPRCDIAHEDKSKTIQLAECEDVSTEWDQLQTALKVAKGAKSAQADIKRWLQHKRKAVLHFIPRMIIDDHSRLGPWFVRFDTIRSLDKNEELLQELKAQRFASITSEFLPSLVERLGAFFSRIGSPDLS